MDSNIKHVLIIDSFRSHNGLAYVCSLNGLIPIHMFSSKKSFDDNFFAVNNSLFIKCLIYNTEQQFLEDIKEYRNTLQFVFGCTDGAQRLKDTIDHLLDLDNKNNLKFANAKYNKFELYQLLNQPSSKINFEEFRQQYGDCIIKPAPVEQSGGCERVDFVNNSSAIIAKDGLFISKFFNGDEYAVDLVSCEGKHKLVSVWRYVRHVEEKVWKDRVELMPFAENSMFITEMYWEVADWLDKLDHKFGPTHIELKHFNGEFFCIEINFRLNGHMSYKALNRALTYTQFNLTVDCYTAKSKFNEELIAYKTQGCIFRIYLLNDRVRKDSDISWSKIQLAPSVVTVFKHTWPWLNVDVSNKTYQSSAAIVLLHGPDSATLEKHEIIVKELFFK